MMIVNPKMARLRSNETGFARYPWSVGPACAQSARRRNPAVYLRKIELICR
jgi:hypothetical protein